MAFCEAILLLGMNIAIMREHTRSKVLSLHSRKTIFTGFVMKQQVLIPQDVPENTKVLLRSRNTPETGVFGADPGNDGYLEIHKR